MSASSASKFHQIPDALWNRVEPLLPNYQRSCKGGRPRLPLRMVVTGILYVLRTGSQWKAMPREFGSGSAIHAYFQEWVQRGVFYKLRQEALAEYDDLKGIDWEWQSLDGAMNKSPLGGKKTGKNPTDRGKIGVKRSVLIDGRGVPLGAAVDGANIHDQKFVKETLDNVPVLRPKPSRRKPQHLCLDKGYVGEPVQRLASDRGYQPHVPAKGNAAPKPKHRGKARRWKVERTHSWLNRARRLLIRWEKKVLNYIGLASCIFNLRSSHCGLQWF